MRAPIEIGQSCLIINETIEIFLARVARGVIQRSLIPARSQERNDGVAQVKVHRPERYSEHYRFEEPAADADHRLPWVLSIIIFGVPLWALIILIVYAFIMAVF